MSAHAVTVLYLGGDAAVPLPDLSGDAATPRFAVERAASVEDGLARIEVEPPDALVVDLTRLGTQGLAALARAREQARRVAVVVAVDARDEALALAALAAGAQECVPKAELDGPTLARAVRRAMFRRRLENRLREASEAAERASESKSEFLAHMSHELRTPLTAIIGFAEIMAREAFGPLGHPRYLEYARDIIASGNFILDLANDVLDLSKVESGKLELREQEVDVAATIGDSIRLIQPRAKERSLALAARIPEDLPRLRADARMVRQILLNLLSNAVKFTPAQGSVTVSARVEPAEGGDGRCLTLSVTDTGVGIGPKDLETVPTPFAQAGGESTDPHRGAGIGLSVVARLMELHGGTLALESQLGTGTTATVRFPSARIVGAPPRGLT